MTKKIRASILAGQIALFALGIFLLAASFAVYQNMGLWYRGPPPALYGVPGIICIIVGVLLFSVLRYKVNP